MNRLFLIVLLLFTPTLAQTTSVPDEMVLVTAGPFVMGITHPRATDEKPAHTIDLDAFYIDRYEVSNRQFAAFVEATGHSTAAEEPDAAEIADGINWRRPDGLAAAPPDHPVVYVSWKDAQAYCRWRNKRLPSEAEWEKSARGPNSYMWPWGQGYIEGHANLWGSEDGYAGPAPVGSFSKGASPYGAHDMAGNVWEWCADWYSAEYYTSSPRQNPPGPQTGRYKILRGGSWSNRVGSLRTVNRFKLLPQERSPHIGFRCARSH